MKVIFLDHDGVICLASNWGTRTKKWARYRSANPLSSKLMHDAPVTIRFDDFDKKSIRILNDIIAQTGTEIVVSSDWKLHATLEELGDFYEAQGIIKRPIAVTGMYKDIFPSDWSILKYKADLELARSIEINHWVSTHPEITNWVAVDDLNMSIDFLSNIFAAADSSDKKPGLLNFVHTPSSTKGIKQNGLLERIIAHLNA